MANIKSAKKRIIINQANAMRNQSFKSGLKTTIKKVEAAVSAGDQELAGAEYRLAASKLDRAVARGIMHKNTAARRKSSLIRRINAQAQA